MHFEHKLYSSASHVLTSITLSMYTRIVICLQSEHHGNINKVCTPKLRTIEQNKESRFQINSMHHIYYDIGVMYRCIRRCSSVLYYVVIPWQSNPPISQFISPCNVIMSVWSMSV